MWSDDCCTCPRRPPSSSAPTSSPSSPTSPPSSRTSPSTSPPQTGLGRPSRSAGGCGGTRKRGGGVCPPPRPIIIVECQVSSWVVREVRERKTPGERVRQVGICQPTHHLHHHDHHLHHHHGSFLTFCPCRRFFSILKLASACLSLNNLNAAHQILSALR